MKLFALVLCLLTAPALAQSTVPFVGCRSEGPQDALDAPVKMLELPAVPAKLVGRLAYYASNDVGVLAPRGWSCVGSFGTHGARLFVTPEPLANPQTAQLTGPGIEASRILSTTSGRQEVAAVASQLFPLAQDYVQQVVDLQNSIDGGTWQQALRAAKPFAKDKLTHRSETEVEFTTPAGADGLGTFAGTLLPGTDPIQGVTIILPDEDMDLVTVRVRLPANLRDLTGTIITGAQNNLAVGGVAAGD